MSLWGKLTTGVFFFFGCFLGDKKKGHIQELIKRRAKVQGYPESCVIWVLLMRTVDLLAGIAVFKDHQIS